MNQKRKYRKSLLKNPYDSSLNNQADIKKDDSVTTDLDRSKYILQKNQKLRSNVRDSSTAASGVIEQVHKDKILDSSGYGDIYKAKTNDPSVPETELKAVDESKLLDAIENSPKTFLVSAITFPLAFGFSHFRDALSYRNKARK